MKLSLAVPPESAQEAAAFFSRYGNVGAPEALLSTCPTATQLERAVEVAIADGQSVTAAHRARDLIMAFFSDPRTAA